MKKFVALVLVLCMFTAQCILTNVYGENYDENIIYRINGEFGNSMGKLKDGKSMVPLRMVMYQLGGDLEYFGESGVIEVQYKDTNVSMKLNSDKIKVTENGTTIEKSVDFIPQIFPDGITYIPARALTEMFGIDVYWVGYNHIEIIDFNSFWDQLKKEAPFTYNALVNRPKLVSGYFDLNLETDFYTKNIYYSNHDKQFLKINGRYKNGNLYYQFELQNNYSANYSSDRNFYRLTESMLVDNELYHKIHGGENNGYPPSICDIWIYSPYNQRVFDFAELEVADGKKRFEMQILEEFNSYHDLSITNKIADFNQLADQLILLEKNGMTQTEDNGVITTNFELSQDNLISFVKAFVKFNQYSMGIDRYEEICSALDEMGKEFDMKVKGSFETKQDGTIYQVLGGTLDYEFKGRAKDHRFTYSMNFTPADVPDIVAPADYITEEEAYHRFYENEVSLALPKFTDNTELALKVLLPFYDTAEPLIK